MSYSPLYFGAQGKGSSRQVETNYVNAHGSTLEKGSVVSTNTSGQSVRIDVSDEDSVSRLVGLVSVDTPNTASGGVISSGRLENVTTTFAVGDALYVDKDGLITNIKPDIGVNDFDSGDFVVFIGVIVRNEFNIALKDIQVMLSVVGQL